MVIPLPGFPNCMVEIMADSNEDDAVILNQYRQLIQMEEGKRTRWKCIRADYNRLVMQNGFWFLVGNVKRQIILKAI